MTDLQQQQILQKQQQIVQRLDQIIQLLEKPEITISQEVYGNSTLKCNCDSHERGKSTAGWYCPVHSIKY